MDRIMSLYKSNKSKKIVPLLFVLPAFLIHLLVITLPSASTIYLSLYEWSGIGKGKFIGLQNFVELFTKDTVIRFAFVNNVKWTLIFITVPIILGLVVALILSRVEKGQMFYRTIYFLPYVLSAAIAGRIWTSYFNPFFGINIIFDKLGLKFLAGIEWLGNPKIALYSVAFVDNWHWWGFVMVLFLAALHQVDGSLYEAANVEGANKLQEFFHITVPGVRPTLVFIVLMTIIWSFLTFDYVWVMTMGGPAQSTEIISTWMYKNAFINYRAGYANAICVIQSLLCLGVFAVLQYIRKKGWDV